MKIARMTTYRLIRLNMRRVLLVVGLGACCSAAAQYRRAQCARGGAALKSVPVTITWAMAERFGPGYDRNHDGRPDLENSHEYVNPGRYEVRLVACTDETADALAGMSCVWMIDGPDQASGVRVTGPNRVVQLPLGTYTVKVTVQLADGRTGSASETIRVKDILIIVLGDSLATGEGNPEKSAGWEEPEKSARGWQIRPGRLDPTTPALWADGGPDGDKPRVTPTGTFPPASATHIRAHRSTHSGPARFAMWLEAADPHTSVTYVCLAATGARTDDLFRPDRSNQNRALGSGPVLPAQLDELHAIVGSRPADLAILALGMNDSRAFDLLGVLLRKEVQCLEPLRLLAAYPSREDWAAASPHDIAAMVDPKELPRLNSKSPEERCGMFAKDADLIYEVAESAKLGLAAPRQQLDRVASVLAKDPILAGAAVYLLEYPDPTGDETGTTAATILDDLIPGLRVNRRELDLVREHLVRPVNTTLREAADRHGWSYVGGIFASFQNHGYAAKDTWFRQAKESELLEGPRLSPVGYLRGELAPGMLHPNHAGHQFIADRLFRMVAAGRCSIS
jgi:lysophospholipase L1-like esterase